MNKHVYLASWLSVVLFAATTFADDKTDSIAKSLDAAPPAVPMTPEREQALDSLDRWLARPRSERDPAVVAYYRAAVDRALDQLENERVASGARIFQLYSSSVIVQTPETVFAFDLDRGPSRYSRDAGNEKAEAFGPTDAQIARLASLVQVSFHTHEHNDHIDPFLTEALLEAGKTVVTTQSNKTQWSAQSWAEKLTVLDQTLDKPIEIGSLNVDVLWDHQWGDSLHTRGTPCNAFIVTTPEGVSVMTKGDINCGLQLYGWLSLLKQRGRHIDVIVGSPIFWRGVDVSKEWDALFSPLWLPGHAWEFGHRKADQAKGNCAGFVQSWRIVRAATVSEKAQVLSWGEWIDVEPRKRKGAGE
jgi:L-ascorbate metabolism protein UlaG (beta-lactamase superfamily)